MKDGRTPEYSEFYIDRGPVSMVVKASNTGQPLLGLEGMAMPIIDETLKAISKDLPSLKRKKHQINDVTLSPVGKKMYESVTLIPDSELTPMAAVAGTVSDTLADALSMSADSVIVNNGGDIALRIKGEDTVTLGIKTSLDNDHLPITVTINGSEGIGGIATSGLGGRSFTKGIASAVTVFASNCRSADAMATYLANTTHIDSDQVLYIKAGTLDPDSDIADQMVTYMVNELSETDMHRALDQLHETAVSLHERGLLIRVMATVGHLNYCYPS